MNWLDVVIVVLIIIPALIGLKAGIIKIVMSLVGLIIGTVLAGRFHAALAGRLTFIPQENLADIAAFAIILVAALLVAAIATRVLHSLTSVILLGWVDHLGGAAFGFVLGVVFCGAALAVWARFIGTEGPIAQSALARLLLDRFPLVLTLLPEDFGTIRRFFQK